MEFGSWKISKTPSECAKMDPLLKDLCKTRPEGDGKTVKKATKKFNLLGTVLSEDEPIYSATATATHQQTACRVVFDTGASDIAVSHNGGQALARALGLTPTTQEVYITLGNGSVVSAPEKIEIPTLTVHYPGIGGDNCLHFKNATIDILSPASGVSSEGEEAVIYIGQSVLKKMGFSMNDVLINAGKKTGGVVHLGKVERKSLETHLNAVQRKAGLTDEDRRVFSNLLGWSEEDIKELDEDFEVEETLEGKSYYEEFPNKISEPPEEEE